MEPVKKDTSIVHDTHACMCFNRGMMYIQDGAWITALMQEDKARMEPASAVPTVHATLNNDGACTYH